MEHKQNLIFLLCQITVALIGFAFIIVKGISMLFTLYVFLMLLSIPSLYFNYNLCKWQNSRHSRWNELIPCTREPSNFKLCAMKIFEWSLYIFALIIALLPM